jgi:AraC-like DNA-binding protein/Tfp pilus assembly protein PilF
VIKKQGLIFIFFCSLWQFAEGQEADIISNFRHLSSSQLLDTANYFFNKNSTDTALVCYSLLINTPVKNIDFEQQKRIVEAYNKSAVLYIGMSDYRTAYDLLIKALTLCEKTNYELFKPRIYANIGIIYSHINKFDMAKSYYSKAMCLFSDSLSMVNLLNNLGGNEIKRKQTDSAFYFLNKAFQIGKRHNAPQLFAIENNLALIYQERKQYDSAFFYFRQALVNLKQSNNINVQATNLTNLGELFFEIDQIDSALFYINLSSEIATKNNFLGILAGNYLIRSKIEDSRGHTKAAFQYYKKYSNLKDSVFDVDKFNEINQLQFSHEMSKVNQQIEEFAIEQRIKNETIHYQKMIQRVILAVLLLVSSVLVFVYFQKRKLHTAYNALIDKNIKIIDLEEIALVKGYKRSKLANNVQDELLDKILVIMDDTSIICDVEFSIEKLAKLVQSNQKYVSQVINDAMKQNFRSYLNSCRIREAQRLFLMPDADKYTIEFVSRSVGYKSRTTFCDIFKEITGVSPGFYLKSMQKTSK